MEPFVIDGESVELTPLEPADAQDIFTVVQDPEILRWTTVPSPYTLKMADDFAASSHDRWEDNSPIWVIRNKGTNSLCGLIELRFLKSETAMSVGFWMASKDRRNGFMTEALRLVSQAAFKYCGVNRIEWRAHVGNWGSWKVAWRNGFRREGVKRHVTDEFGGKAVDMWVASLINGDSMEPATPWDGPGAIADSMAAALDSSKPQQLVAQFHSVYSMPNRLLTGGKPTVDYERLGMRLSLIAEEYSELVGALYGIQARRKVEKAFTEAERSDDGTRDLIETADALADLVYVIYGFAIESGIDLDRVLAEVQASNLSKLMPDGTVKLREDGKVLKGPDFFQPRIARALGIKK